MEELCCVGSHTQGNNANALPIIAHSADTVPAIIVTSLQVSHGQDSGQQQFVECTCTQYNISIFDETIRLTLMQCGIALTVSRYVGVSAIRCTAT